jgi:hypothetical protein
MLHFEVEAKKPASDKEAGKYTKVGDSRRVTHLNGQLSKLFALLISSVTA